MKKITAAFVLLWILPCCGCTAEPASSSEHTAETAGTTTVTTAVTVTEQTTLTSEMPETDESDPDEQETENTGLFQGGIGDERNAATPLPEFFAYRFQPDSFSARLAGGNYQTIPYDLSEAFQHTIDTDYYLADYDSDGDYDLYLPIKYEENKVSRYAVFCWDSVSEKFQTEPVIVGAVA